MHSGPKETDENGWGGSLYLFLTVLAQLYGGNDKKRYPDLKTKAVRSPFGCSQPWPVCLADNRYVRSVRQLCQKVLLSQVFQPEKTMPFHLSIRICISSQWQGHHEVMRRVGTQWDPISRSRSLKPAATLAKPEELLNDELSWYDKKRVWQNQKQLNYKLLLHNCQVRDDGCVAAICQAAPLSDRKDFSLTAFMLLAYILSCSLITYYS